MTAGIAHDITIHHMVFDLLARWCETRDTVSPDCSNVSHQLDSTNINSTVSPRPSVQQTTTFHRLSRQNVSYEQWRETIGQKCLVD
jgi:hypothetical protein